MASVALPPLPAKFGTLRPHQIKAIQEVLDAFRAGYKVVFLSAPTGTGKTIIGEQTWRALMESQEITDAIYMCSDIALQEQFCGDFPYAVVMKGRGNYPTENAPERWPRLSCADCTASGPRGVCIYCTSRGKCPYNVAKTKAMTAQLAVLNSAYFIAEASSGRDGKGAFSGSGLVVIDECDTLEGWLLNSVAYEVTQTRARAMGMDLPVKGARVRTLIGWLRAYAEACKRKASGSRDDKEVMDLQREAGIAYWVAGELTMGLDGDDDEGDEEGESFGKWVRIYDEGPRSTVTKFVLQPVLVARYGNGKIWRHADRFLLMSASIISAEEMAASLGIPDDMPWTVVDVPMTFPVENRPIIMAPVVSNTFANRFHAPEKISNAVGRIMERHPGERILVHCVSYALAQKLHQDHVGGGRPAMTYEGSRDKKATLTRYLASPDSVLFAPSMDRGVDLPDDACRVVVVAKMPYLGLKDRRVNERMRMRDPDGQLWYTVQNVRSFVQMIGRGVRHKDDWCVTYVVDAEFGKLWRQNRHLLPEWVREAVDTGVDVRWIMQ